ncbi:unnamed protein product [Paramecium octaurelia]|uniref:Uncharacterized protein n=1 Tax=Paramecium octaurelia TaxID=43137 RepID=A0A8S1TRX6_PAROT|nr:unnamed protein product [Paramecium octaurelia]
MNYHNFILQLLHVRIISVKNSHTFQSGSKLFFSLIYWSKFNSFGENYTSQLLFVLANDVNFTASFFNDSVNIKADTAQIHVISDLEMVAFYKLIYKIQ